MTIAATPIFIVTAQCCSAKIYHSHQRKITMIAAVTEIAVPLNSEIAQHLTGAYFADAYEVSIKRPTMTALEIYLSAAATTPAWIEQLMTLRNRIVGVLGLKNLGNLGAIDRTKPASAYRVGDRVGIFVIHSLSDQEAIFADSDKHLNVRVSVRKTGGDDHPSVVISTVVHVHNMLGRVYLFFVVPAHRRIVPAMLRRLGA
jgi:hypothetical protein